MPIIQKHRKFNITYCNPNNYAVGIWRAYQQECNESEQLYYLDTQPIFTEKTGTAVLFLYSPEICLERAATPDQVGLCYSVVSKNFFIADLSCSLNSLKSTPNLYSPPSILEEVTSPVNLRKLFGLPPSG